MKFNFEATGIGSVPFKDPKEACEIILGNFPSIPFWPQLPKITFRENMYSQYSEKMPGIVLDEARRTIHVDSAKAASGIEKVYGKYLEGDVGFFGISESYARGLYEFLGRGKEMAGAAKFIKGHVTGPISFALMLTDQDKKPVLYDKDLFEVLTKVLVMKVKWQVRQLKEISSNIIIFLDEPYLVSLGSSYVNIDPKAAFAGLDEVVAAVKSEGALAGLHCCGNTDWPQLLKRDIDIINFDAYNFTKEFLLYKNELKDFFAKGGTVAWGMVPSDASIDKETARDLASKLKHASGISSIVTPSCGTGTLDENVARKVLRMTKEVSRIMQGS